MTTKFYIDILVSKHTIVFCSVIPDLVVIDRVIHGCLLPSLIISRLKQKGILQIDKVIAKNKVVAMSSESQPRCGLESIYDIAAFETKNTDCRRVMYYN